MANSRENELQQVQIKMVPGQTLASDSPMKDPKEAIRVIGEWLGEMDRELFCIVNLQTDLRPINMNVISVGALSESLVHPREVMKSAILSNAHAILLIHNHPSNSLSPSKEDIALTNRLSEVGQLMGIPVVDHVITNREHEYFSMNEKKMVQVSAIQYTTDINQLSFGASRAAEEAVAMETEPKKEAKQQPSKGKDLSEIMDSLENGVKDLFTSEKYTQYLKTMSKFHHYSFNNTLLIAMQKPDATLVAGYNKWQSMGRQVRKGEKGIRIIAPAPVKTKVEMEKRNPVTGEVVLDANNKVQKEEVERVLPRFKVSTVFDISQTEGDPIPTLGADELVDTVERYEVFMQAIGKVSPVPIRFDEIESGAHGFYHNVDKEIVIQQGMSELQTMKTAIHEVAHAKLHDRDIMEAAGIKKDSQTREVEAESVAYAVCQYFGLDTSDYSFPYIAGWSSSKDMRELKASMDVIRKTSGSFIDDMSEQLQQLQEHAVEYFYVSTDLKHAGHGPIGTFHTVEDTLEAYYRQSPNENRELGIQHNGIEDRGVTLLASRSGLDIVVSDMKNDSRWETPEMQKIVEQVQETVPKDSPEKLAADLDRFAYDYDTYEYNDGISDSEQNVEELKGELEAGREDYISDWLYGVLKEEDGPLTENALIAQDLIDRVHAMIPFSRTLELENTDDAQIRYYVAECGEFLVLGEYHENISLPEAMEIYEKIPPERMNGIPIIGYQLRVGNEEEEFAFYAGGKILREDVDNYTQFGKHPLVQGALKELEDHEWVKSKKLEKENPKQIEEQKKEAPKKQKKRGGQEL